MVIFLLIVLGLPVFDVVWWCWAHLRLRGLPHARRWRLLLAAFMIFNLLSYGWLILARTLRLPISVPAAALAASYIWHLVVLPTAMLCLAGYGSLRVLIRCGRWLRWLVPTPCARAPQAATPAPAGNPGSAGAADPPSLTRRQVLSAAVVALPPLATAAAQARALSQLDSFRVRPLRVVLPALPPALDGLTIAHLSDIHVGRFTSRRLLNEVVERTNALRPDLVLMTGDLIDFALADLAAGLDVLKRVEPRVGLFVCEGNHDLFEDREEFERRVRAAGLRLLLNESATLRVRGETVQILGLRWGQPGGGHGALLAAQMEQLLLLRRPGAFTILLAHHPHAFDRAVEAGIPLTLSGHTHGGQLMLSANLGAGPLLFKYWSGLYRQGSSALVVSNGIGNWFPLRINAPAEILHLTLAGAHR
jgi:predicted MPP superfamily phosphohydrolase